MSEQKTLDFETQQARKVNWNLDVCIVVSENAYCNERRWNEDDKQNRK